MTETYRPHITDDEAGPTGQGLAAAGTPLRELAADAAAAAAPEVTLPGHLVHIALESGEDFTVRVDNRDLIRWDKTAPRQKWNAQETPFLFQSFIGWAAAKRAGVLELDFDTFLAVALEVKDVKPSADDEARPTR